MCSVRRMGATLNHVAQQCREAAFGDVDFDTLLRTITAFVGGDKAILLGKDRSASPTCNLSFGHDPEAIEAYQTIWRFSDPRRFESLMTPVGGVAHGQAYKSNESIAHTDYYEAVAIAGNVQDSVHGIVSDGVTSGRLALSIHRGFEQEFFGEEELARLKAVLPHLRSAIDTSVRVAMLDGRTADAGFCACIDHDLHLVPLGGSEAVAAAIGANSRSRVLTVASERQARSLKLAVRQAQQGRSVKLRMKGVDIEIGPRPAVLGWMPSDTDHVMLVARARDDSDEVAQLQFFALSNAFTPRETEVLLAYSQHFDVRKAAASIGLSYETARWHSKNMLGKCGLPSLETMVHAAREGAILD